MIMPYFVAVETNVDALDADIQIVITYPAENGVIRLRSVEQYRFSMADVKDGTVTYEHTGDGLVEEFKFDVSVEYVDTSVSSNGTVVVHVTNVTLQTPAPNVLRVVTNVVAIVDELGTVQLSASVLKVLPCFVLRLPTSNMLHPEFFTPLSLHFHSTPTLLPLYTPQLYKKTRVE